MTGRARQPIARRALTDAERQMALALGRCRFVPASFDKRFAHTMAAIASEGGSGHLSQPQALLLRSMVQRYRRQLPAAVVALADEPTPPGPDVEPELPAQAPLL